MTMINISQKSTFNSFESSMQKSLTKGDIKIESLKVRLKNMLDVNFDDLPFLNQFHFLPNFYLSF